MIRGALTTEQFLQLIGERLKCSLSIKDFIILTDLYATCAGFKKKPKEQKKQRQYPRKEKPQPPTMDEMILHLEKELKNGQQYPEREGQQEREENETRESEAKG